MGTLILTLIPSTYKRWAPFFDCLKKRNTAAYLGLSPLQNMDQLDWYGWDCCSSVVVGYQGLCFITPSPYLYTRTGETSGFMLYCSLEMESKLQKGTSTFSHNICFQLTFLLPVFKQCPLFFSRRHLRTGCISFPGTTCVLLTTELRYITRKSPSPKQKRKSLLRSRFAAARTGKPAHVLVFIYGCTTEGLVIGSKEKCSKVRL